MPHTHRVHVWTDGSDVDGSDGLLSGLRSPPLRFRTTPGRRGCRTRPAEVAGRHGPRDSATEGDVWRRLREAAPYEDRFYVRCHGGAGRAFGMWAWAVLLAGEVGSVRGCVRLGARAP